MELHKLTDSRLKYAGVLVFVVIWWLLKATVFHSSIYLPGPIATFAKAYDLFATGDVLADIRATLQQFALGYFLAVIIGIPCGLVIGFSRRGYAASEIVIDFFRSIPVTSLLPLFILFFGISSLTITAMVLSASIFVILLNSAYGVIYVNETRIRYMKSLKATWIQTFREVIIFEALPFIFVGLRVSISFALIVVVVSEMFIGTQFGLGARVYRAHETFLISDVYALILIIGLLGYLLNKIVLIVEGRVIHWQGREKQPK